MPNSKSNDKSNNIGKIRNIVQNTEENLANEEISKEFADDPIQLVQIAERNARRKQAIEELKGVIKDEVSKGKK